MQIISNIDINNINFSLVSQKFNTEKIEDVRAEVYKEFDELNVTKLITPNMRIGVTAGSRGIANISIIIRAVCDYIKGAGGSPFIIPAMGSHGGATAEGQTHVLEELGITEETMQCPIISSMDVVKVGVTSSNVPVYLDKNAFNADGIVVVNRIKPHTDFDSVIESGLTKMIAVGLGKAKGCATMHSYGLGKSIPESARVSIQNVNIMFGLGIIENSRDETFKLKAILAKDFEEKEKELLKAAKNNVPKIPIDNLDVLVVKEMGKMISGTGMDTKVIGRIRIAGECEPLKPAIKKVVILNLAASSHGNALGVGLADITTKKLVDSINLDATYANTLATTFLERAKIPITMNNDKDAIIAAMNTCGDINTKGIKMAIIENTLDLKHIYLSDATLSEIEESKINIIKRDVRLSFDEEGNLNM